MRAGRCRRRTAVVRRHRLSRGQVTIDGIYVGVAPIYPWIYTGGIDPGLWRPTPGIQTLSFEPYRVDLTPYAAWLSDGQPHRVAVRVFNAQSVFLGDGESAALSRSRCRDGQTARSHATRSTMPTVRHSNDLTDRRRHHRRHRRLDGVARLRNRRLRRHVRRAHHDRHRADIDVLERADLRHRRQRHVSAAPAA